MNPTTFIEAVSILYPGLRNSVDYLIVDLGTGPELAVWPQGLALPSDSEQLAALLVATRQRKLDEINALYEGEFAAIKRQYPDAERESWPIQLSEAAALAADPQAETPFLDGLRINRGFGEAVPELAEKVRLKNAAYIALSFTLTGKRHRLERQVLEAETPEQVQAIAW